MKNYLATGREEISDEEERNSEEYRNAEEEAALGRKKQWRIISYFISCDHNVNSVENCVLLEYA